MIEDSRIYDINYFTEIKLNRMLIPNNSDDKIFLFIHSVIHNFTSENIELLVVDHQQFQVILEMLPKEDAKEINELIGDFLVSNETYFEYQFNEIDELFVRLTKFYFVVSYVENIGNEDLLDLPQYQFEYPPYVLKNLIKKEKSNHISIDKPSSFGYALKQFAEIYDVFIMLKSNGYTEDEAMQLCGLTNPVVFELLSTLNESSEINLNISWKKPKPYKP
jgi:hypothetical protein